MKASASSWFAMDHPSNKAPEQEKQDRDTRFKLIGRRRFNNYTKRIHAPF
jgi:hypothetical protein